MGLLALLAAIQGDVHAQVVSGDPRPGRFGAGLQAGPLSGFSIKVYPKGGSERQRADAAVLTGAFNLKGFAYFQASILDETPVRESPLTLYLGPGLTFGTDDNELSLGLVGTAGIRFFKNRVEIYMEISPRLEITPAMHAVSKAGVGFRIYP